MIVSSMAGVEVVVCPEVSIIFMSGSMMIVSLTRAITVVVAVGRVRRAGKVEFAHWTIQ